MSAIIPLTGGAKLPAYLANRAALATINQEAITHGASYPVLSIKGKVFTLVKGDERKVLMREDDPDEVLQSVTLAVVRANPKSRVFYAKAYSDDDNKGEAGRPDCYSSDGVAPAADARDPQASKCATCPHAVWGSKVNSEGKGTACAVNTRLAVVDPNSLLSSDKPEPYLLRLPAGTRANFSEVVKKADARGIPYNAPVLKVGFDKEAPAPKLTFKIIGLLDDTAYTAITRLYEDETVKEMVGLAAPRAAPAEEPQERAAPNAAAEEATEEELEDALAGKPPALAPAKPRTPAQQAKAKASETIAKASAKSTLREEADEDDLEAALNGKTAAAAPTPAPAPAPAKPKVSAAPKAEATPGEMDGLLGDLNDLLSSSDD